MKRILGIVILLLVAACSQSGCGSTTVQHALDVSLAATNGAAQTLREYSDAEQGRIVHAAKDEPSKLAALAAFQAKRAPVLAALSLSYTAIAVAASKGDAESIAAATKAVVDFYNAVHALVTAGGTP